MRNSRGQTLIEAAIILPIVLLLVFAIVDYGRAMYTKNTLTNAASTGARTAAVTPSLAAESVTTLSSSNSTTAKAIQNILAGELDQDTYNSVTYELAIVDPAAPGAPGIASARTGNQVRITLSLPSFQMWTPFTSFLAGITNSTPQSGSITLTAQSAMRYE
jgi:Flp pilus assembly protein TadG